MAGRVLLSIGIVVHKSNLKVLESCLISVFEAADTLNQSFFSKAGIAVYILDNSLDLVYSQALAALLTKLREESLSTGEEVSAPEVTLVHRVLPENSGYGVANNILLSELSSQYHLVLNPDVYLDKSALLEALQYLVNHSSVVLLAPRVDTTHVVKCYPDCLTLMLRYLKVDWVSSIFEKRLAHYCRADLIDEVSDDIQLVGGCFMLMPTVVWQSVEGFDPRFFMYFEDFDLSLRLAKRGKLVYVPSVKIHHKGGDVGRKSGNHHRYFINSALKFFNKHGWKLF